MLGRVRQDADQSGRVNKDMPFDMAIESSCVLMWFCFSPAPIINPGATPVFSAQDHGTRHARYLLLAWGVGLHHHTRHICACGLFGLGGHSIPRRASVQACYLCA